MNDRRAADLAVFEDHRPSLLALSYRMLGDMGRAEDMVQDAWLRWHERRTEAESPRAFLLTLVTRLCLNELDSARARREESRSGRLPEPVDLDEGGMGRVEAMDRVSMAFLVVLQRLTPAERAALLLHDVFDFGHTEIAALIGKSEPACRKLLERARAQVADARRTLDVSRDEHARILGAFVRAVQAGDTSALVSLLAEDATLISDGGPGGRVLPGGRTLAEPLVGAKRVAAFVVAATARSGGALTLSEHELNGQAALVFTHQGTPAAALMLGVADGRVQSIFLQADAARLGHLGRARRKA
jgi:RNA polymerase sigma-70 factor (ECF subfamily)